MNGLIRQEDWSVSLLENDCNGNKNTLLVTCCHVKEKKKENTKMQKLKGFLGLPSAEDSGSKPSRSPRLSPRGKSPREDLKAVYGAAVLVSSYIGQEDVSFRFKPKSGAQMSRPPSTAAVIWFSEPTVVVTVEVVCRPTSALRGEKVLASKTMTLQAHDKRGKYELGAGGAVEWHFEDETTEATSDAKIVVWGGGVVLLLDARAPPAGLLVRLNRKMQEWKFPNGIDVRGLTGTSSLMAWIGGNSSSLTSSSLSTTSSSSTTVSSSDVSNLSCTPLSTGAAAAYDEVRHVLLLEERSALEDRLTICASLLMPVLSSLYDHGFREHARGWWVPDYPPLSSTAPTSSVCSFCTTMSGITIWGDAPPSVVNDLVDEFTEKPFSPLSGIEGGFGLPGLVHRFDTYRLDNRFSQRVIPAIKNFIRKKMQLQGQYVALQTLSSSMLLFIRVGKERNRLSRGPPNIVQHVRISIGSKLLDESPEDHINDPEIASALVADTSCLVSDFRIRYTPSEFSFNQCFESCHLGKLPVAVDPKNADTRVLLLHQSPVWQKIAWKGNGQCRIMRQALYLSILNEMARIGYGPSKPHFPAGNVPFCRVAPSKEVSPHAFVQLIVDADKGATVEIHCLGKSKDVSECLRSAGVHHVDVVDDGVSHDSLVTVRVSGSEHLLVQQGASINLLDDEANRAHVKQVRAAESRCFTTLMRVLTVMTNNFNMEPLTITWKHTLGVAQTLIGLMRYEKVENKFSEKDEAPALSVYAESPLPEFSRLKWGQMPVQGFLLKRNDAQTSSTPSTARWIRISSSDRFTDIHGDFTQKDGDAIIAKMPGTKLIAGKDEKKHLLCWSISRPEGPAITQLLEEARTFEVVNCLRQQGWLQGPEGNDHGEVFLFQKI